MYFLMVLTLSKLDTHADIITELSQIGRKIWAVVSNEYLLVDE